MAPVELLRSVSNLRVNFGETICTWSIDGTCALVEGGLVRVFTLGTDDVSIVVVVDFITLGSGTMLTSIEIRCMVVAVKVGLFEVVFEFLMQYSIVREEDGYLIIAWISASCGDSRVLWNT